MLVQNCVSFQINDQLVELVGSIFVLNNYLNTSASSWASAVAWLVKKADHVILRWLLERDEAKVRILPLEGISNNTSGLESL